MRGGRSVPASRPRFVVDYACARGGPPPDDRPRADASVTMYLKDVKAGRREAFDAICDLLRPRVERAVSRQLRGLRSADPEGVTSSVFRYFWVVTDRGDFSEDDFQESRELWAYLMRVAKHKVRDHARYGKSQKRDVRRTRGEDSVWHRTRSEGGNGFDTVPSGGPTPAERAASAEALTEFLASLPDDVLRDVAVLRMEGYSVEEVATRVGVSPRTVKRKLQRLRDHWTERLPESC